MIIDIILVDIVLVLFAFHFVTAQGNEIWYTTLTPKKGGFSRVGCGGVSSAERIHS